MGDIEIFRSTRNWEPDDCKINVFHGRESVRADEVVVRTRHLFGRDYVYAEPVTPGRYAFGGTILYTSNGNFPAFNTPIKLHDRDMSKETK